jgi:Skp family chaperone for outer membrane proteins
VTELGAPYSEAEGTINRIFDRLDTRIRSIIMGSADDAVKGVTDQLTKASAEIQAEVQKLQDAGVSEESLAGLKGVAQSLDDRNPDAPAEEPPAQ